MNISNVKELRDILANLPDEMAVFIPIARENGVPIYGQVNKARNMGLQIQGNRDLENVLVLDEE